MYPPLRQGWALAISAVSLAGTSRAAHRGRWVGPWDLTGTKRAQEMFQNTKATMRGAPRNPFELGLCDDIVQEINFII